MRDLMRATRPWAVLLVVSVFLSACGDDGDPSGPAFSAESASAMVDASEEMVSPLDPSNEVNSNVFNAYTGLLNFGGGAELASAMVPMQMGARMRDGFLNAPALPSISSPTGLLLPDEIEGLTFAWSATELAYVATGEPGAPANGVRFLYYAIDPTNGRPATPLNVLGYVQFVDASTETVARLEIDVVRSAGNEKLVDYFVQGAATGNLVTSTATIDAEGFISDGADRADFDIQLVLTDSETSSSERTDVRIESNDGALDLLVEATETETGYDVESTFVIEQGSSEAVFGMIGNGDSVEGSLRFNGREVVVFEGAADSPEFTRPDGSALTADEIEALGGLWYAFAFTYGFVFEVLFPFILLMAFAGL